MSDTWEAILRTAGRMMQMRGFASFSFAHIAEQLDVKPAAIHYHFRTKSDLGLALIERYSLRYRTWMDDAAGLSAVKNLEGLFGMLERFSSDGRACFEGVLEVEYHTLSPEMQAALKAMVHESHTWLTGVLERGRKDGELKFTGPADVEARCVFATLQGALQIARIDGPQIFERMLAQVKARLYP